MSPGRSPASPTGPSTRCWSQPTSSWAWWPWCSCCRLSATCLTSTASPSSSCCPARALPASGRTGTTRWTSWAPSPSCTSTSPPAPTPTTPPSPGSRPPEAGGPGMPLAGPSCPRPRSPVARDLLCHTRALWAPARHLLSLPPPSLHTPAFWLPHCLPFPCASGSCVHLSLIPPLVPCGLWAWTFLRRRSGDSPL